ncbi:MAG: sulfur carrier protein ThiS [Phycisphaerae bacterium]|nr:sulfur carrier protein ThiS [Phycisphaerae bacterium]
MRTIVNGRDKELRDGMTIAELLAHDKIEHVRVAVELNGQVVPRQDFSKVRLRDGDSLEVVTLVGGG